MTPANLTEYLRILKAAHVASARVVFDGTEINVVFAPDMDELPGDAPEPGGWKGPARLDDGSMFDLTDENQHVTESVPQ